MHTVTNKAQEIPSAYRNLSELEALQPTKLHTTKHTNGLRWWAPLPPWAHRKHGPDTTALCGKTYACKGYKTVWAKPIGSGWDKRQATLVLIVSADGVSYIKPDIYFKGTDNPILRESYFGEEHKHYYPRVGIHFNKKGYCNEETTSPAFHHPFPYPWRDYWAHSTC